MGNSEESTNCLPPISLKAVTPDPGEPKSVLVEKFAPSSLPTLEKVELFEISLERNLHKGTEE